MPAAATKPNAALLSLATSLPPHVFLQKDVLAAAWDVFGPRLPQFETLSSIFANTGIIKRHGVKPFDWYLEPRGWPERTEAFLEGAEALFVEAAEKALANARSRRRRYRHHRHRLLHRHRDAEPRSAGRRPHGVSLRRRARAGVRARLRRRRLGPVDRRAAGAGAARQQCAAGRGRALHAGASARRVDQGQHRRHQPVRRRRRGDACCAPAMAARRRSSNAGEQLWPDTLDIMGWSVDPEGFGVIFQRTIPDFVDSAYRPRGGGHPRAHAACAPTTSTASSAIPAAPR